MELGRRGFISMFGRSIRGFVASAAVEGNCKLMMAIASRCALFMF